MMVQSVRLLSRRQREVRQARVLCVRSLRNSCWILCMSIPKDDLIGRVTITEDYINHEGAPRIEMRESGEAKLLTQRQE